MMDGAALAGIVALLSTVIGALIYVLKWALSSFTKQMSESHELHLGYTKTLGEMNLSLREVARYQKSNHDELLEGRGCNLVPQPARKATAPRRRRSDLVKEKSE